MKNFSEWAREVAQGIGCTVVEIDDQSETNRTALATLERKDGGQRFGMRLYNGRVEVFGLWPRDKTGQIPGHDYRTAPKIKVSSKREPAAAARDIGNRFLPQFLIFWSGIQEQVESFNAAMDGARENATMLAALDDHLALVVGDEFAPKVHLDTRSEGGAWGDVTVRGGNCEVHLRSVSIEMAKGILRLIVSTPRATG